MAEQPTFDEAYITMKGHTMNDPLKSLKQIRNEILENLDAAERSHEEDWQFRLLERLYDIDKEIEALEDENEDGRL